MASSDRNYLYRLTYRLILAVIRIMSFIPFRTGQFLGRVLGSAFAIVPINRTRVSLENLRFAFGDYMEANELKRLNRHVVMHFGEMLFEIPHILRLNLENLDRYVVLKDEEHLLNAMKKGKGIFILTAHFGNWELMSVVINLCFAADGAIVARPIDFSPADRVISDLRSRFGAEIISKDRGMRKIVKALRDNRAVGILLDQNVDWYSGVFVDFLGRQACVNKGLALIALRNGTPVVPAFSVRQPDGRYRIIFEKEVDIKQTGDRTKDIEENTAIFTGIIEKYIRQYPDHWFWFHKRWKTMFYCPLPNDYFGESGYITH